MSILKIEPSAINPEADFSLGSLSVAGNVNIGSATIAATESGDLAFTTASGTFDITANTVNFLNTVATTEIAPGESISTGGGGGSGATGGGTDQVFVLTDMTVTANYAIPAGKGASTVGPVTINDSITVSVPTGSRWVVL